MLKLNYKILSITFYSVSLFTPIFIGSDFNGLSGLFLGWIGLFELDPFMGLPWLANIFYFINLIFSKLSIKIRLILSLLSITLGLFTIGIEELIVHEGGLTEPVSVGIGFGIWMSSFLILLIGQLKKLKLVNVG